MKIKSIVAILFLSAACAIAAAPVFAGDPPEGEPVPAPVRDDGIGDGAEPAEGPAVAEPLKDGDPDAGDKEAAGKSSDKHRGVRFHGRNKTSVEGAVGLVAGLLLALVGGFSVLAFLTLLLISFPGAVAAIRDSADLKPGFSFLVGLVNTVFVLLLVGALGAAHNGPAGGMALLILLAFGAIAVLGLSGRAQLTGAKAATLAGIKSNQLSNLALGFGIVYFTGLIPVVGWVLLAYWLISGVGAVAVSVFSKSRPAAPAAVEKGIKVDGPNYMV